MTLIGKDKDITKPLDHPKESMTNSVCEKKGICQRKRIEDIRYVRYTHLAPKDSRYSGMSDDKLQSSKAAETPVPKDVKKEE